MKILILDDDENRHQVFRELFRNHDRVHCYSHAEAVDALDNEGPFDFATLDHDLGGTFVYDYGRGEVTGLDTAYYIATRAHAGESVPPRIQVHSWNTIGGPKMVQVLTDAGLKAFYKPFKG